MRSPPVIFGRRQGNTQVVAALNEPAERLRLRAGMGLADARAIHPAVEVLEDDPAADRRLIEAIADLCDRYTPLVAIEGGDGLFLDITGCAHLFGGEAALLRDATERLANQGFDVRAGLASTPGTAWAAARYAAGAIVAHGAEGDLVAPLPLAALRLEREICASLESVGLRCVGAVMSMPRAPLVRRFGRLLPLRLDQALGQVEEAVSPRLPVPPLSVERHLAEPVVGMTEIEQLAALLAGTLKVDLERRGEGARALALHLFRVDGEVTRIAARTSRPLRDTGLVQRLFRERLAVLEGRIDAGCGFDLVRLSATATAPLPEAQGDLTGSERNDERLAEFVDRVHARFGSQALLQPEIRESHIPEEATRLLPIEEMPPPETRRSDAGAASIAAGDRPLRLFDAAEPVEIALSEVPEGPPRSFRWRHVSYRIARAEGPERISPEWWLRALPVVESQDEHGGKRTEDEMDRLRRLKLAEQTARLTRDYFHVEDFEGRRFWLYREGVYGAAAPPRWYMQGLFA